MKCELCNKEFKNLGNHLRYNHNITSQEYYDKFIKQTENEGACFTCGKNTQFLGITIGYRKFCSCSCSRLNEETQKKYAETNLKRYNDTNPAKFGSEKFKAAIKEKYGVENISQNEEIKKKKEKTFLQNHGIKNNFGNPEVLNIAIKNSHSNIVEEKRQNTSLKKYNNKYHIASKEVREKSLKTYKEKYGVINAYSIPEIHKKAMYNSLRKNNNGNDSSFETLLENAFINKNIIYIKQYKEERYPFHCDFYLPDTDTFIEINGYWTHGKHFFDKNNEDDLKTLKLWKNKAQYDNMYNGAITTWTNSDIKKRNTAKENNLNYIVLWTLNDIYNYIKSL